MVSRRHAEVLLESSGSKRRRYRLRACDQPQSGRYERPSETGELSRMVDTLREISTSTRIVARYGSADRNCDGTCQARALGEELRDGNAAEEVGAEQHARRAARWRTPPAPARSSRAPRPCPRPTSACRTRPGRRRRGRPSRRRRAWPGSGSRSPDSRSHAPTPATRRSSAAPAPRGCDRGTSSAPRTAPRTRRPAGGA